MGQEIERLNHTLRIKVEENEQLMNSRKTQTTFEFQQLKNRIEEYELKMTRLNQEIERLNGVLSDKVE